MAIITSWSLQSPDTTPWQATIDAAGLVTWTTVGGVLTATPPVYLGATASVIWTPSISNAGIVSITSGVAAAQDWAALIDPDGVTWYFTVDAGGTVSVSQSSGVLLDEVAIYNTALSLTRMQAHYAARTGTTYPTEVLADTPVGYWRLGEPPLRQLDARNVGSAKRIGHKRGKTSAKSARRNRSEK